MIKYNLTVCILIGLLCVMLTGCGNGSAHDNISTDVVNMQNGESQSDSASEETDVSEDVEEAAGTDINKENILDHGQWKGLQWELTESGQLTVTGHLNADKLREYEGYPWYGYSSTITEVYMDFTGAESLFGFFQFYENLARVDLSDFDTSNVTDMGSMFWGCSSLTELDLSNFDTGNVTNMGMMFEGCSSLTELNLSNFDTSNVTDMNMMFSYCSSLTELDLSSFDTGNVTDMSAMFYGCTSLTELHISNFDTTNVTDALNIFSGCKPQILR